MAAKQPVFPSIGEPKWSVVIALAILFIILLFVTGGV